MKNYSKKELINFAESIDEYDTENKNRWIKEFCLSNISDNDKVEVLMLSRTLFKGYESEYKEFANLINSKKYLYAVRLSKLLSLSFPERKEDVKRIIKNQELYFVLKDFEIEIGGTGVAVLNRLNHLVKRGYIINLIIANGIRDYDEIRTYYYEKWGLSSNIRIINFYEYFSNKNTLNSDIKKSEIDVNYNIKKIEKPDTSIQYKYYDKTDNRLIKKEIYIKGYLAFRIHYDTKEEYYYTPDGFNYLSRITDGKKVTYNLNDRKLGTTIEFKSRNQILGHFINEFCDIVNHKPIIVFDSIFGEYSIKYVNSNESIKIGSLHGNPYFKKGKPEKGLNRKINKKITHFNDIQSYKSFVVLSDSIKQDLKNDLDYKNIVAIPNLIPEEKFDYDDVEKDLNKISIFSRISPEKNLSDAIKAFKIVADKNKNVVLEIYGRSDHNEKDKLVPLIKELNLEENIIFKKFISDTDTEMRKSLCTLMTSYYEGLPMAILESMANSTPVISYDTNYGPKDIITNDVDGIIVEFGDYESMAEHIIDLLENPNKAINMGIKAKEKIMNNYSADVVCSKWEDLFIDVYVQNEIEQYEKIFKNQRKLKELKKFKKDILNSTSWNMTKPFRNIKKLFSFKN